MIEKIATAFGHSDIYDIDNIEVNIQKTFVMWIEKFGVNTFYLGNNGKFDYACARVLKNLKKIYPHIKTYLILAYLNKKLDDYDKQKQKEYYNGTIYPPISNTPLKFAILKRNQWMINQSSFVLCYVKYTWGGASTALEYATQKKKQIINIAPKIYIS